MAKDGRYDNELKEMYGEETKEIRFDNAVTAWAMVKEACNHYPEFNRRIEAKVRRHIQLKKNGGKKFAFITIQDKQRRLDDIEKLQLFINRIAYMYDAGFWTIEAGKSDPPNVHIHLFVRIKNSKKHKASLNAKWMALFNTNLQGDNDYYKLETHNDSPDMPSYKDWYEEKMVYIHGDNEQKGDHMNSIDLNLRGGQGCQSGFLLPYIKPPQ